LGISSSKGIWWIEVLDVDHRRLFYLLLELVLEKKDKLKDQIIELIKKMKNVNIQVKFLRLVAESEQQ
jgi:hypothetical protein